MTAITRDVHVFARSPIEMEGAQKTLVLWATNKISVVYRELVEAQQNLDIAKKNKWRHLPWQNRVSRLKKKIVFYQKIRSALKAGYYILPPFPGVDVFAIRTKKKEPKDHYREHRSHYTADAAEHRQEPQKLIEGEGEYRSALPTTDWWREDHTDKEGKAIERYASVAVDWNEVDFPFTLVKPEIMAETAKAMALKVFDQLGVLPRGGRRKKDPIVVGQILHPDRDRDPVTFFIGWWLDTSGL